MPKHNTSSSIRRGFEYQDYWGLRLCRDWLLEPNRYQYIQFETSPDELDTSRFFFDDIICQNEDESFDIYQVKHRQNPSNNWTWEDFLISGKGKKSSLLKKWSSSVKRCSGRIKNAFFVTDAKAGDDISIYEENHTLNIAKIKRTDSDLYSRIKAEIGTDEEVTLFFEKVHLLFGQKTMSDLKSELFESFYGNLRATKSGVNNLLIQLQEESSKAITERIDLKLIRKWCEFDEPRMLNENFEIPSDFEFFDDQENKNILNSLINERAGGVKVIIGKPGVGKSVYLSKLSEELQSKKVFTIKHHFHLSPEETNSQERLNHERVIEALKAQLKSSNDLGDLANKNSKQIALREFINEIAQNLFAKNQNVVIIVDGLDHVIRYADEEELRSFLQEICYPQPGLWIVLGMQPHIEKYLPQIIIDKCPKDSWIEIKGLSLTSVSEIIKKNVISLNLPSDESQLNDLIKDIYNKTSGNSLHLRYTLKQLKSLLGAAQAHSYSCRDLTPYGSNIESYYELIWRNTSEDAKTLLLAIGSVNFIFTEQQLIECASFIFQSPTTISQSIKEIEHLISVSKRGKINVYHNSFELFIKDKYQKDPQKILLKRRIKEWLGSSNQENLKWSELKIIEQELGNYAPILEIDRDWLIDAISSGRNTTQISRQLRLAAKVAFDTNNFSKALAISHLYTYYLNSKEFVEEATSLITDEAFASNSIDFDYIDLSQQTDSALISLIKAAEYQGDTQAIDEVIGILIDRLRWQEYRLGEIPKTTSSLITAVTFDRSHETNRIYKYIIQFRDLEVSGKLFSIYAKYLLKLDQKNKVCKLLQHDLTIEERKLILHECAIYGLKNTTVDFSVLFNDIKCLSFLSQIYLFLKSDQKLIPPSLLLHTEFPEKISEHDSSERSKWREHFHDTFLLGILYSFNEREDDVLAWTSTASRFNNWAVRATQYLLEASLLLAKEMKAGSAVVSTVFNIVSKLDELVWPHDRDRLNFQDAFREALKSIFQDISLFKIFLGHDTPIDANECGLIVNKSSFFNKEMLLDIALENEKMIFDQEVFSLIKSEKYHSLKNSITTLSERAVSYVNLAKLSRIFSDKDNLFYLNKSIDNLIGYGYHKDGYLYDVIDAIEVWMDQGLDQKKADDWIRRSARLIEHVTEYTDGDGTGSLYIALADVLAKHRPKLLYKNYYNTAEKEELRDAEELFKCVLQSLDFQIDEQIYLGSTALNKDSYLLLQELAESKTGARQSLDIIEEYLGNISYPPENNHSSSDAKTESQDPTYQSVNPDSLTAYITTAFENIWERNSYLTGWVRYWLDKFDHGEIYQLIKNLKEKYNIQWTSYDLLDLLYPIAYIHDNKNAFDLLVEAQINDHGWDRHWTEKSKAVQRWSFLKDKFPGRYIEFFQKSTNNHVPLSRGVEFFLFFGDTENAALVLNSGINFAESLTADITLDAPTWINEKDIDDLALLLQRMVWPSPLIRERAINGIAKLLCTNHKKAETFQKILTWLQLQKMESTVAIGLLPIIRAFDLQHSKKDLSYINLTTIINALPFSSVVVDKLIEELAALTGSSTLNTKERLSVTPYHENYSVDPFFEKYINTFLPPIYLNRAKKINPYKGKDFVKQWAFTAKEIAKEANVKFNANQCYYYSQYKGADLLRGFSSRISEVFRSAFLRVLHFYYINECVPTDFYLEYAYATLPIELSRWKIGTNRCPNWWPKFKIDPDHKTGKDEILQLQLEAPIQPSRILDNEKVLLAAEGAIKPSMGWENDPMHSFSLLSFGYKVLGNELPSPEEVIDAINYHSHLILIPSITKRPFHFLENKDIFLTTDTDEYLQIKDLIVYPILSREKDLAIGLWQYFRDFFDGLNLRPELTENLNLTLTKNSWVYRDKSGSIYAEHRDWIEGLKERYDHDLPIPYGNFLTIDKGHIQSWAQQNNLRIGYVLRIVNRFKEYSYADVKEFKNTEFIDVSSIITP